jgi:4-hydroxy-tetrahydrodipicolinate synthase
MAALEAARIAKRAQAGRIFGAFGVSAGALHAWPDRGHGSLALQGYIASASDLPLTVFQYPLATGQGYPAETLNRLFDEIPTIRAIKDWTPTVPQHEAQVRALQSRSRPVNVLSTNSAWLLSSLVLGCKGLLSGSGSVIADLQARLFRAVAANDLAEARRLNDRIHPVTSVFYADPFVDMHNRMKEALVLLGRLPRAVVRPPLVKIRHGEIARIRKALVAAGLLDESGKRLEAA